MNGAICRFNCLHCGAVKVPFMVRYRGDQEPIDAWMKNVVQPALRGAHLRKSPLCRSPMVDLQLPMEKNSAGLGQRPYQTVN